MESFLDHRPQPDDEVGGHEVHQAEVWEASAEVEVESRVEDDDGDLEAYEDQ